jgi:RNA polymerase sigma-70 factor (ECF subfamily)
LWLFGVARRVLANHRRTDVRRERLERRLAAVGDGHRDVEPDVAHAELGAALRGLTDDDRAVVIMRCWDGLTVGEIAALLECSPNAVSIRLHRARRQLAARLASKGLAVDGHVISTAEPRKQQAHEPR